MKFDTHENFSSVSLERMPLDEAYCEVQLSIGDNSQKVKSNIETNSPESLVTSHASLENSKLVSRLNPCVTISRFIKTETDVAGDDAALLSIVKHSLFDDVDGNPSRSIPNQVTPETVSKAESPRATVSCNVPSSAAGGGGQSTVHHYTLSGHVCRVCGKSYDTYSAMVNHCKTHNGDRPHECPHCEYRAKHKHHVKIHVRRRHPHSPHFT